MNLYKLLARPVLFRLPSDRAHELTIRMVSSMNNFVPITGLTGLMYKTNTPSLHQKIWGLHFPSPVGLAAGFDKNGTTLNMMEKLGFGFVEVGSITADSSLGNPKPRSFRLVEDHSLINRMGLNNDGAKTIIKRLEKVSLNIPMGINIAKTHSPKISGQTALDDYKFSYDLAKPIADYVTINISCPNTEEGKTFEDPETLNRLLNYLEVGTNSSDPPVLIKVSVDGDGDQLREIIEVSESFAVSGYIATNTSSNRENLTASANTIDQIGPGGLSGRAIRDKSTEKIRLISEVTKGEKTVVGVGGIFSADDAIEKIKAGADLLQIYTGMIYEGPGIVKRINEGIAKHLKSENLEHIYQLRK